MDHGDERESHCVQRNQMKFELFVVDVVLPSNVTFSSRISTSQALQLSLLMPLRVGLVVLVAGQAQWLPY